MTDTPAPERYGRVKYATIRRDFAKLRAAIRAHDTEATEGAWDQCERWLEAIAPNEAAAKDAQIKALVEALKWFEKHRLDAIARADAIHAREDEAVKALCERHGYGAVMDSAARQWAKKPHGSGAFFVGGCIGDLTAFHALASIKTIPG